jgi:hypothetical protein
MRRVGRGVDLANWGWAHLTILSGVYQPAIGHPSREHAISSFSAGRDWSCPNPQRAAAACRDTRVRGARPRLKSSCHGLFLLELLNNQTAAIGAASATFTPRSNEPAPARQTHLKSTCAGRSPLPAIQSRPGAANQLTRQIGVRIKAGPTAALINTRWWPVAAAVAALKTSGRTARRQRGSYRSARQAHRHRATAVMPGPN